MSVLRWVIPLLALCAPHVSMACTGPPPPFRLPTETDGAYAARTKAVYQAAADENRRSFQVYLFDQAASVELARVTTSSTVAIPGSGTPVEGRSITAEPVLALKGEKSAVSLSMTDQNITSCGIGGAGPATSEKPGAWIVVYTGIILGREAPRNFGLPLSAARDPRLMKAVDDAALALRKVSSVTHQ